MGNEKVNSIGNIVTALEKKTGEGKGAALRSSVTNSAHHIDAVALLQRTFM